MLLKILVSAAILGICQGGVILGRPEGGNVIAEPYLIGGSNVTDRIFPSMVSIQTNGDHICGGVILTEYWILTAAQCVRDLTAYNIRVVVGSNLLDSGVTYAISTVKIHEQYDYADSWKNDIAVIKTQSPIKIIFGTQPASLPPKGFTVALNTSGTVVGWGSQQAGGNISNQLQRVDLAVGDINRCNASYHYYHLNVYKTQYCDHGLSNRATCDGDMGTPFFYDNQVYGLVSWGKPCGFVGYPTVYTKVSEYVDWIHEKIK